MSICVSCSYPNNPDSVFCANCGNPIQPATHQFSSGSQDALSGETRIFQEPKQQPANIGRNRSAGKMIGIVVAAVAVVAVVGLLLYQSQSTEKEILPDRLGFFLQGDGKDRIDELKRQDFSNGPEARRKILEDDSVLAAPATPNFIFNLDSRDISVNDLRLVQMDTINADGTMKQLDFQAAQVDGKADMKRLRVPESLANGKYAFVLFDGYLDEGKHKFWPFHVKNSTKADNGSSAKLTTVAIRSKSSSAATSAPATPPLTIGIKTVYGNGVRVRTGPGSEYPYFEGFRLNRGSKVNVVGYIGWECPNRGKGCGPWAQTDDGHFVHSSLLR